MVLITANVRTCGHADMEKELSSAITLFIADGYEVNRVGLRVLFESIEDFEVLGEATNGQDCVRLTLELKPSVVIMDIPMPLMNGLDATREIKKRSPETKIIILTSHSDKTSVSLSLESGADGYCLHNLRSPQLMLAIRSVADGNRWLDPTIHHLAPSSTSRVLSGT